MRRASLEKDTPMIEKILKFSIQKRYIVILLTVGFALFGLYSLFNLPIDAVPDVTNNQIQINTASNNLSPLEVESLVTFPIENAMSGIPGLESTRSISRHGFSQVTAIFRDNVDIYFARQQVGERLREVSLPEEVEPQMGPVSTGLGEVYMWAVEYDKNTSPQQGIPGPQIDGSYLTPEGHHLKTDEEKLSYLRLIQDWVIAPQLKGVSGLAEVDSIGGYVLQVHVNPHLNKLKEFNLSFDDIIEAIQENNLSQGSGFIQKKGEAFLVKTDTRVSHPDHLKSVVVATREGRPILLDEVADIALGQEFRSGSSSKNGEEVVIGTAMMLSHENSRKVAKLVKEKLHEIKTSLPNGIQTRPLIDRTKLIDSTIKTVLTNLVEGACLVIFILFFMLSNFKAALIVALVIPLSMLMTAIGMVEMKISGNLMSLGALDFGLIVDGAVIIVENCLRQLRDREKSLGIILPLQERLNTVMEATKEMIQPTLFGQAIIIMVYLPILALSGTEGKMFHPMAMTVIFMLVAAFILSLTFIPAMVALFVKSSSQEEENRFVRGAKWLYQPILSFAIKKPILSQTFALILLTFSGLLFYSLGQEFIPTLDEHDLAVQAVRTPSTSLAQATKMQFDVEKTLLGFDEVQLVFSKTGTAEMASDPMPPDASDTFVILKPFSEWRDPNLSKLELISMMEEELKKLPGNNFEFSQPIQMRFNELIAGIQSDVAVKIYGDDFDKLEKVAIKMGDQMKRVKGASDITIDKIDGQPIIDVDIDRMAAARYGLSMKNILDVVSSAIGGRKAGILFDGDRKFDIVVKLNEEIKNEIELLKELPISLPQGGSIPLKEVATFREGQGLNEINRENGKRHVTVQANIRGNDMGSFIQEAKEIIEKHVSIPPGYWIGWGGQYENLLSAKLTLMWVVPLCFLLILILLTLALHSLKLALLVFTGIPFALCGGIFSLWLRDMPFSISSAVGFIALSGIATLNGLVMVTFIKQLEESGMPLQEAIKKGALVRLRPVLMTALVASLGFIPMAFSMSAGSEVQKPLATVVIGGLITSTLLTLVILPALYRFFGKNLNAKILN